MDFLTFLEQFQKKNLTFKFKLCFFKGFLVFEIRKNIDLRKILVTPKIFLKSRVHCTNNVK